MIKTLLRMSLLAVLITGMAYVLLAPFEIWCNNQYQIANRNMLHVQDFLLDTKYTIPDKLEPAMQVFYDNRDVMLTQQMLDTRKKFTKQSFIGSVMTDGFHAALPSNAKWQNHMVEIGDMVKQEVDLASAPTTHPDVRPIGSAKAQSKGFKHP